MKNNKAVTLIALIITIIILLILAGVVIAMTVGDNGLIKKALLAEEEYENAQNAEQKALEELEKQIANYNKDLPENTADTEAGTQVQMPTDWYSTMSAYISTEDGSIVKKMVSVASVTAVATGNGETVPVPEGFFYVGGKINSGVVISDDSRDRNKYAGIADVPAGAIYNSDGTVKTYTDAEYNALSNDDKKAVLLGNQFVWIPVSVKEYTKRNWGYANATWETQTNTAELPQIEKYRGFYVGRYEAGTSNISLSTNVNFASKNTSSDWKNDKFSIRDGLNHTVTGKITTKAGEIPYYYADYFTALKLSNSMYNTNYVRSGLVTGTMWDAIMKFIANGNDNVVTTESSWGNYIDGQVTYTAGKGRYATVGEGQMTSAFTKMDNSYHDGIKTTAISEDVKKKNLYDIAGNLWEWTQEAAYKENEIESYMLRGGCGAWKFAKYPACSRGFSRPTGADSLLWGCFRPALYIK